MLLARRQSLEQAPCAVEPASRLGGPAKGQGVDGQLEREPGREARLSSLPRQQVSPLVGGESLLPVEEGSFRDAEPEERLGRLGLAERLLEVPTRLPPVRAKQRRTTGPELPRAEGFHGA